MHLVAARAAGGGHDDALGALPDVLEGRGPGGAGVRVVRRTGDVVHLVDAVGGELVPSSFRYVAEQRRADGDAATCRRAGSVRSATVSQGDLD